MVLLVLRDPLSPDQGSSIAPSAQQLAGIWLHFPSWPCCRGLSAAWLVCAEKAAVMPSSVGQSVNLIYQHDMAQHATLALPRGPERRARRS